MSRTPGLGPNLNAFLDMLAWSEGTSEIADDGYGAPAGRYQLAMRHPKIDSFGPIAQDAAAIRQVRDCKAILFLTRGRLKEAVKACSPVWPSLRERKLKDLAAVYKRCGGGIT
jgi:muramidase (phage lysozyme)